MPTFPPSPLKFRTAGIPQYGFKASLSAVAFQVGCAVKRAPRMPTRTACYSPAFARVPAATALWVLSPTRPALPRAAVREAICLFTPGVLGSDASSAVSRHHGLLRPHPPVPRARNDFTAGPFIRRAFAVRERLGDPRDLPYFSCRTVCACRRPYAGGSAASSRYHWCSDARLPRFTSESPPTKSPSLPAILDGVLDFGAATFALCCGPYICQALLTGYDQMESRALHRAC